MFAQRIIEEEHFRCIEGGNSTINVKTFVTICFLPSSFLQGLSVGDNILYNQALAGKECFST